MAPALILETKKEEQMKSIGSRRTIIVIKVRTEINKTEKENTTEENNEVKTGSLRKSIILINLVKLIREKE